MCICCGINCTMNSNMWYSCSPIYNALAMEPSRRFCNLWLQNCQEYCIFYGLYMVEMGTRQKKQQFYSSLIITAMQVIQMYVELRRAQANAGFSRTVKTVKFQDIFRTSFYYPLKKVQGGLMKTVHFEIPHYITFSMYTSQRFPYHMQSRAASLI